MDACFWLVASRLSWSSKFNAALWDGTTHFSRSSLKRNLSSRALLRSISKESNRSDILFVIDWTDFKHRIENFGTASKHQSTNFASLMATTNLQNKTWTHTASTTILISYDMVWTYYNMHIIPISAQKMHKHEIGEYNTNQQYEQA